MTPPATPHHRRFLTLLLAAATLLATSACAGAGGTTMSEAPRGSQNRIIQAELANLDQLSAYQAIERLRPRWLRGRLGRSATVVLGGNPGQDLSILRSVRATDIREMRFLSAGDATTRYGTGYDGGAIVVDLKGG